MPSDHEADDVQAVLTEEYAAPQLDRQFSADLIGRLQAEAVRRTSPARSRISPGALGLSAAAVAVLVIGGVWIAHLPDRETTRDRIVQAKTDSERPAGRRLNTGEKTEGESRGSQALALNETPGEKTRTESLEVERLTEPAPGHLAMESLHPANPDYAIANEGLWPKTWPKELEPLRPRSRTCEHNLAGPTIYEIPFTDRKEFESAWPFLLKLKSDGAPVILFRGPHRKVGATVAAGVRVLAPGQPITPAEAGGLPVRTSTDIELIVDGDIVDLNRIPLPADTPLIDKRFEERPAAR